ncbi:hypothetical protein Poly41_68250 [Novipirellula artificiosorum]|uniref:Peptidase M28 domain-containing protein n=2 Tax=Novipirellula artificiosorum TaxID=2528016 RepID=A0A5C6CZ91_9BACT|nr:hypothetical protein Poly41_68250 [Novipirellula artificiosorum]
MRGIDGFRSDPIWGNATARVVHLHVDRLAGLIGAGTLIGDEATNLLVEQPGTKRASEIVRLGAHYDTISSTLAADDNTSAVSVMLTPQTTPS